MDSPGVKSVITFQTSTGFVAELFSGSSPPPAAASSEASAPKVVGWVVVGQLATVVERVVHFGALGGLEGHAGPSEESD